MARALVSKNMVRYVLIIPRWALLVVVAILICVAASPFGPAVSSHV